MIEKYVHIEVDSFPFTHNEDYLRLSAEILAAYLSARTHILGITRASRMSTSDALIQNQGGGLMPDNTCTNIPSSALSIEEVAHTTHPVEINPTTLNNCQKELKLMADVCAYFEIAYRVRTTVPHVPTLRSTITTSV